MPELVFLVQYFLMLSVGVLSSSELSMNVMFLTENLHKIVLACGCISLKFSAHNHSLCEHKVGRDLDEKLRFYNLSIMVSSQKQS